ncbi:MAG: amidohydrolase family protein [Sphaerochaetaceae bacterium]
MLLKNARFIDSDQHLATADIRIEGKTISRIAAGLSVAEHEEAIDCRPYIILPGFADSHTHNPDTLLRGLFRDSPMEFWCGNTAQGRLQQEAFGFLDALAPSEDFKTLCLYAYLQYLRQGVVFLVETGQADDSAAILKTCIEEIGLKALVDFYDEPIPVDNGCTRICTGTHLPEEEELDQDLLDGVVARQAGNPTFLMTHCLETAWRKNLVSHRFGQSTVELMKSAGLLDSQSILFHCVQVADRDIDLIKEAGANVVHCPVSNQWSGAGDMPLGKMLEKGINVLLGTDFLQHDYWETLRTAYYGLKRSPSAGNFTLADIFNMATRNAGAIAGQTDYAGRIAEGLAADLCFVEWRSCLEPLIENCAFSNSLHNIIFYTEQDMVRHVMIDGRWVMRDRHATQCDESDIEAKYAMIQKRLFSVCERPFAQPCGSNQHPAGN